MILEFLPHRACDHILPTLLSVRCLDLLCHVHLCSPPESLGLLPIASCTMCLQSLSCQAYARLLCVSKGPATSSPTVVE